jgi:type I restriction enzyme S subunit
LEPSAARSQYEEYVGSNTAWLGQIPAHWETTRVQHVADIHPSSVNKKSSEEETPVRLCNYTDVYYGSRISDASDFMEATATDSEIETHELRAGDVLVTKDSEARDDIAVPALVERDMPGVLCGYHLAQLRPSERIDGAYLYYCFKTPSVGAQFEASATGITRYGLGVDALKKSQLYLPPLDEQRAIADYLDRETDRIDALIEKKEQLIDLLEEKRTALISRVVTQGLDSDVEMQDSGVEWLGEIPAGWRVAHLKHYADVLGRIGWRGYTKEDLQESGPLVLGASHITKTGELDLSSTVHISRDKYDESPRIKLRGGEVLLVKVGATIGKVAVVPSDLGEATINPNVMLIRPDEDDLSPKYLGYLLASRRYSQTLKADSLAGAQDAITQTFVGYLPCLIPPFSMQQSIVKYLNREESKIKSLIRKVEEGIEQLKEYRTALISAAVTGQIDVREDESEKTDKEADTWDRVVLILELIRRMRAAQHESLGRTLLVKMLYLIQHHVRVTGMGFNYKRKDFGPYASELRYEVENALQNQDWIQVSEGSEQVRYELREKADRDTVQSYFQESWGDVEEQIDEIVSYFHHFDAERAEIVATLYAAWNDLKILDRPHDEDAIIREVRENWHPRKREIDPSRWRKALRWMKDEGLVPTGFGEPTIEREG